MSALDDWQRIPYPARRKILDALASVEASNGIAAALDPEDPECPRLTGPEMTHEEERDLATAIALLEEMSK